MQTVMRCWDALLSEGAKIVYRIALALLKTHEGVLLAQDNAGYVLREMKLASVAMHDRDALLKVRRGSLIHSVVCISSLAATAAVKEHATRGGLIQQPYPW